MSNLKINSSIELGESPLLHISITSDKNNSSSRPALSLIFVIDRSDSMKKINKTINNTISFIVSKLDSFDRVSIVSFSDLIHIILPLTHMNEIGKKKVNDALNAVICNGSTNIADGLFTALHILLEDDEASNEHSVASVFLFTDGQANIGLRKTSEIIDKIHDESFIKSFSSFSISDNISSSSIEDDSEYCLYDNIPSYGDTLLLPINEYVRYNTNIDLYDVSSSDTSSLPNAGTSEKNLSPYCPPVFMKINGNEDSKKDASAFSLAAFANGNYLDEMFYDSSSVHSEERDIISFKESNGNSISKNEPLMKEYESSKDSKNINHEFYLDYISSPEVSDTEENTDEKNIVSSPIIKSISNLSRIPYFSSSFLSYCSINTFGYQSEHDCLMLSSIAFAGMGQYYFIPDVESLPLAFLDCIAGLMNVVAKNISLNITSNNSSYGFTNITSPYHSSFSSRKIDEDLCHNNNISSFNSDISFLSNTISSSASFFINNIQLDETKDIILNISSDNISSLTMNDLSSSFSLSYSYLNQNKQIKNIINDFHLINSTALYESMNRLHTINSLNSAYYYCIHNSFDKASKIISDTISHIKHSTVYSSSLSQSLLNDLNSSLSCVLSSRVFGIYGASTIISYIMSHSYQRSCASSSYATNYRMRLKEDWLRYTN